MSQEQYSRHLIERTKTVWQPYMDVPLSDQDAIQILDGMLGLTDVLQDIRSHHDQA